MWADVYRLWLSGKWSAKQDWACGFWLRLLVWQDPEAKGALTRYFLPNVPPTHVPPPTSLGVAKRVGEGHGAIGCGYTRPHKTPWAKGTVTQPIDPALPPSRPHCGLFYSLEPQFTASVGNQTLALLLIEAFRIWSFRWYQHIFSASLPHCERNRKLSSLSSWMAASAPNACLACRCNLILHQLICSLSRQTLAFFASVSVCVQVGMVTLLSSLCPRVSGFLAWIGLPLYYTVATVAACEALRGRLFTAGRPMIDALPIRHWAHQHSF